MAYNGTGTYALYTPGNPVVTGTVISSSWANNTLSDIATALSTSMLKDGTQIVTANIPMATFKFTGLGAGSAATDSATLGQVAAAAYAWAGTAGGTADALTLTPTPAITAYAAGQMFRFKSGASANTGATTIAISGLATIAVQVNGAACIGGEIEASQWYQITVDATATACQLIKLGVVKNFRTAINTGRATVASAATTADIWGTTGNQIDWTGTVTCTGFPAAPQAGAERTLVCAGAAPFTAGANMLIDGVNSGATVTCAANDKVVVRAISTTQFMLTRIRYDGKAQVESYTPTIVRSPRTSNTILAAADLDTLVDATSGTFTQTLTAAATLGSGWYCYYLNSGTGDITLDPDGAELIDGLATFVMYPKECRLIQCTGTAFTTVVITPFFRTITTTLNPFVVPPGYGALGLDLFGGGGGGGAGCLGATSTERSGGSGGGGGARVKTIIPCPAAGTSVVATIGAGGTGAAAQATSDTIGDNGVAGGNTTFGSYASAYGGGYGIGGNAVTTDHNGGGGGGSAGAGGNGTVSSATGAAGGLPSKAANATANIATGSNKAPSSVSNVGNGGGGSLSNLSGCAEWGGGAGGTANNTVSNAAGSSVFGPGGGGAGGTVNSSNTAFAGSAGGASGSYAVGGGGALGAVNTSGTAGAVHANGSGQGGGGGGGSVAGTAGSGAAGADPGGGGGGGGAAINGQTSGAGGAGGRGEIRVWGVA